MTKDSKNQKASEKAVVTEDFQDKLSQSEEFISKNKNILMGLAGAIILAIAGVVYFNHNQNEQNLAAQEQKFASVFYFEADSLDKALEGDADHPGLSFVAKEYDNTKAGKLANLYVGVIHLQQGEYQLAIDHLKKFDAEDLLLQARAYSLIGDAYMELENHGEALNYYKKASEYKPNEQFTPTYMMKAALAYEKTQDFKGAVSMYDKAITLYPKAQEINDFKKFKARAEALANNQ